MKCNPKRTIDNKRIQKYKEDEQREQEYLASLSEEEREKYLEKKKQKRNESLKMASSLFSITKSMGFKEYYNIYFE